MKVIIHPGMVKTGSTFIQKMLWKNQGILKDSIGLAIKGKRTRGLLEAGKAYGRRPNSHQMHLLEEEAKRFFEDVRMDGHDCTLFSDETLIGAAPYSPTGHVFGWGKAVLGAIERARGDVEVEYVVYYRDFTEWERSTYNQLVKYDGVQEPFQIWRNRQPYQREWGANFETLSSEIKCPIIFVDIKDDLQSGFLGRALLDRAGLSPNQIQKLKKPEPQNISLNSGSLTFIREINKLGLPKQIRRQVADLTSDHQDLFVSKTDENPNVAFSRGTSSERPVSNFSSETYWTKRYSRGENSGAGSYGRLANYKSDFINDVVRRFGIESVIEFGSGDGNQASMFNFSHYTGVDISAEMIERCQKLFSDRDGWRFQTLDDGSKINVHDMSMSLDVIYHLVEDDVYHTYMNQLFDSAEKYVLIYASDKNTTATAKHVRHRKFSDWIDKNRPNWRLLEEPAHPYPNTAQNSNPKITSFASFKLYGIRS